MRAPQAYWQGLFTLPRSIWMPIIAMSFIAIGAFLFNEWSVRQIESNAASLALLNSAQQDLAEFRIRAEDAGANDAASLAIIGERLRLFAVDDPELLPIVQRLKAKNDFRSAADELRGVLENRVALRLAETARSAQLTRLAFAALTSLLLLMLFVSVRLLITDYWRQESARREQTDERLRLEQLVAERTTELSDLTAHQQNAAEQEKAALARDLHDEFGGLLTAAKMDLAWLQGRASGQEPETLAKLESLADVIDEAMDVKRRVVENLRPALLDYFGLPTALQSYFEETCKKAGIKFTARTPDEFEQLHQDVAIALFRVGQESLTNILKHAKAENVDLALMQDDTNYRILITDDGVGIAPERLDGARSHGLVGMRHRIESLGGRFTIGSNAPHGTRIEVIVPRILAR